MRTISVSMPFIGPHSTVSARQMPSLPWQSWHTPSMRQGVFLSSRSAFLTAAVLRARFRAASKSGQILLVPATMKTRSWPKRVPANRLPVPSMLKISPSSLMALALQQYTSVKAAWRRVSFPGAFQCQ